MITETNTAIELNTAVQNPLGLEKIHHVEFTSAMQTKEFEILTSQIAT
jgi:hypothetical protein